MPFVLINKFRGAIAGSILGYLIGLHYSSTYQTSNTPISSALDLSWLAHPQQDAEGVSEETVQGLLALFFNATHENSSPEMSHPQDMYDTPNVPVSAHLQAKSDINRAIAPILQMLEVLTHLVDDRSTTLSGHTNPTPLRLSVAESHPLQAIFTLFPILLLYHESTAKQQRLVEPWLQQWQYLNSEEWSIDFRAVGLCLAQAIQSNSNTSLGQNVTLRERPSHHERPLGNSVNRVPTAELKAESSDRLHPSIRSCCDAFLNYSSSYEMGTLSLLHTRSKKDWAILPLMTGLTGSLLGCNEGFSGLPLIWQHTISSYQRSLTASPHANPKLDRGTKLAALWSGLNNSSRQWLPTTTLPRSTV